jgi:hypothetical protein
MPRLIRNLYVFLACLLLGISAIATRSLNGQQHDSIPAGRLPEPTGPYAIGIAQLELTDSNRGEWAPDRGGKPRIIPITVIYPAVRRTTIRAEYLPESAVLAANPLLGPNSQRLAAGIVRQARKDAPPASRQGGFPVVLFSPGRGERAAWYTALHEELASHGVIVITIAHAGMADVVLADGTLIRHYPAIWDPKPAGWDAHFDSTASVALRRAVYDSFYVAAADYLHADMELVLVEVATQQGLALGAAGMISVDTAAVVAGGHSYGVNVAVEACHRDPRVRGCFSLDGGAFATVREVGLRRPYLLIRPAFENDGYPRGVAQDQLLGSMRTWAWEVNLVGANHRSFMDAPFWAARGAADTAAERIAAITAGVIRAFIATVGTNPSNPAELLHGVVANDPNVIVRTVIVDGGRLWR